MRTPAQYLADEPHFVYRAYDAEGLALYIGVTANLRQRFDTHRTQSRWFPHATKITLVGPFVGRSARTRAMWRESELIAAEKPLFNVAKTEAATSLGRYQEQFAYLHSAPRECVYASCRCKWKASA